MQSQAGESRVWEQLGLLSKSLLQDKSKQNEMGELVVQYPLR